MKQVIIIGGGASGMMAALTASAAADTQVTLLERQSRVGRKLLSTGNGRCNLTNLHAAPSHYHGEHPDFAAPALSAFGVEDTLSFFRSLGLVTAAEDDGKVYPYSNSANSVLDVLRFAMEAQGVQVVSGASAEKIKCKDRRFSLLAGGEVFAADCVIVACGGAAGSKLGGVMDGYQLLKSLGHHRTALYPALVQIKTDPQYPRSLKGVKAEAHIAVFSGDTLLAENQGEILFTEYGVSGPAVFEISRYASMGGDSLTVELDLWPALSEADVRAWLAERQARLPQLETAQLFTGALHNRLGQVVGRFASLPAGGTVAQLSPRDLAAAACGCKHFLLPVTGTCGFDSAQVTAGGMRTEEFDPQTMQSRLIPGLYACGEVLDIDGDCGGFNLQWAWSSGHLAGQLLP